MTPYEIEKNNFKRYFITQNRMQNAFNDFKNKYLRIVFLYSYSCLLLFFKVENLEIVLSYLKRNLLRKLDSSGQILLKIKNIQTNNKEMRTILIHRIFLDKYIFYF